MCPPLGVRVRGRQLACLRNFLRRAPCPRTRLRGQRILLSHAGYPVDEIARITCHSDDTVRRWLHRFLRRGCPGLREAPHPGRPTRITPLVEQLLRQWVSLSPRRLCVHRPSWTTENLARLVEDLLGIAVTPECIRQHLHRLDFVCRRPTWTVQHLAREQPGYAPKKGRLLAC